MDQNTLYGLIILGVAAVIGFVFFRKFISIILLLLVIAGSAWYFFFK